MKIGIDISCLVNPLTGIGRYTLNLVKELSKKEGPELFLYSHSKIPANIVQELKNCSLKVYDHSGNKILKFIKSHFFLPHLLKKDNVYIFWGPSHKIPFFMSKKIPSIVTIHDLVYKRYPETMAFKTRFLSHIDIPHSIKKSTHILTVSLNIKEEILTEFNIASDKISVIYNGINSSNHIPLKKQDIPENYILFVGTLEPRKNLKRLIEAYARLSYDLKYKYPLLIAGGRGWGDMALSDLIQNLNLKDHIHLLGYVDDETLESLYAHCSFLAYPSLYEGFGLPIIEAAKYGKRVLTSNTSSMPEVAGDYGVYVDPLSVDSIYEGLKQLMHDHTQKEPLQKFTWEKSANDLIKVFERFQSLIKLL
jgi:glycosyltransferase involved in cell wall biosynthesis